MFVYLSKKIAIPNSTPLHSCAWCAEQGWIACGGDSALLKVLKLDADKDDPDTRLRGVAAPSNLSMNQTLEGHNGAVLCTTWNANFKRLTTSDENGLIIVWMLHKRMWFEEMINNRNQSVVRDMKWTSDGQEICIVYQDGAVIVGSVNGNRRWGEDLNTELHKVEWSPDGSNILFVTVDGRILVYDSNCTHLRTINLPTADVLSGRRSGSNGKTGDIGSNAVPTVIAIHWYDGADGHVDPKAPTLAIAFDNGCVQLTRGIDDDSEPLYIRTRMRLTSCQWNPQGTILALAGSQAAQTRGGETRDVNMVRFFTPKGVPVRTLKVPGRQITALSWEGSGLRIALAVDAFIYFANVRPTYKWTFLSNSTLVYSFFKPERCETAVAFWNTDSKEHFVRYMPFVRMVKGCGEHVVVLTGPHEDQEGGEFTLHLCDSIGASIETRVLAFEPKHVAMGPNHIVVATHRTVYTWNFSQSLAVGGAGAAAALAAVPPPASTSAAAGATANPGSADPKAGEEGGSGNGAAAVAASAALLQSLGQQMNRARAIARERAFDIDNVASNPSVPMDSFTAHDEPTADPISAITASDRYLIVGRESGALMRYTLPHLSLDNKYDLQRISSRRLELNSDSSRLLILDAPGAVTLLDLNAPPPEGTQALGRDGCGCILPLQSSGGAPGQPGAAAQPQVGVRKDVWDLRWADDDPEMFVILEKTRMFVFRDTVPEEPIISSGYVARFSNLEITAAMLDNIVTRPEDSDAQNVIKVECAALKQTHDLINHQGLEESFSFVSQHPHPRLWELVAEAALEALDFGMAERAFVRSENYAGIRFVQRVSDMADRLKQHALVAQYLERYDDAERIYKDIDRIDLAVDMRRKQGQWFKVAQMLQRSGGDDGQLQMAWNNLGEQFAERHRWNRALQFFRQAKNYRREADCLYHLEDFTELHNLAQSLPEGSELLPDMARMFESVGLTDEAVECYQRGGDVRAALDCCVLLKEYAKAVALAEEHNFPQLEGILAKHAFQLMEKGQKLQAVELYRNANKATEAALLLAELAEDAGTAQANPLLAKKLHVLAAMEVERQRQRAMDQISTQTRTGGTATLDIATVTATTMATLDTQTDGEGDTAQKKKIARVLDSAWRGAAAYHYFILAQKQLLSGEMDSAMKTSIRLCEFEDILSPRYVFSLVALTSYRSGYYDICSRAFIKLETLPPTELSSAARDRIQTLAVNIFTNHEPVDPQDLPEPYMACLRTGRSFRACTASGKLIKDEPSLRCGRCHHYALERELTLDSCPLCHNALL